MTIYKLSNTYCLHNIYTPFSREPHNIYTTYPHYLHTIYTISTHLVEVGEVVVLVQHLLCRSLGPGHRQRWCAGQHYHLSSPLSVPSRLNFSFQVFVTNHHGSVSSLGMKSKDFVIS